MLLQPFVSLDDNVVKILGVLEAKSKGKEFVTLDEHVVSSNMTDLEIVVIAQRLATKIESTLFQTFVNENSKDTINQYRSILSNLNNKTNQDLRLSLLSLKMDFYEFVKMTPNEMASDH